MNITAPAFEDLPGAGGGEHTNESRRIHSRFLPTSRERLVRARHWAQSVMGIPSHREAESLMLCLVLRMPWCTDECIYPDWRNSETLRGVNKTEGDRKGALYRRHSMVKCTET